MTARTRTRYLWLSLALCVVFSACTTAPPPTESPASEPRSGGTVVIGSISDVDSWNEYISRQAFTHGLLHRIYLRLAVEGGDGSGREDDFSALLAHSWSFSQDGRRLTFALRDATWSDGVPITASDVRFTWRAQTSEHVPWIAAESKRRIQDVIVEDANTVTFVFDAPYPHQLADAVEGGIVPEHLFGAIPFVDWATHDWTRERVASGPFMLSRHLPGDEIVMVRNPRYFGDGPYLDRVVVKVIPDIDNLLTQVRTGHIDYIEGVTPRDAEHLRSDPNLTLIPFDRPGYDFIGWNGSRPPFDDPEMRRAMTLAIDRESLVDDLLYGYGKVSSGPLLSAWRSAGDATDIWSFDPDEARRLLRDHGWRTRDKQGRETDGRILEIELLTNSGNRLREAMLLKIQDQLSRVGVEVSVATVEMRNLRQRAAAGDYDGYLGGWIYSIKDLRPVFDSEFTYPDGANVVFYSSDEVDHLFDEIDDAGDWNSLDSLLRKLQTRIYSDQPYTFLYESKKLAVHGPRVRGARIDTPSDPLAQLEHVWVE